MPPRKRRGKQLVAAVTQDSAADAAVSPEYVEAVIDDLERESERRVKKLKRAMGDMRAPASGIVDRGRLVRLGARLGTLVRLGALVCPRALVSP